MTAFWVFHKPCVQVADFFDCQAIIMYFLSNSLYISFDVSGMSAYYKQPYFLWDAYHDTSEKMSFYIEEALIFQISFEPEYVADSSPIIF